jgi:cellulose biosynthesis protein BcsQ
VSRLVEAVRRRLSPHVAWAVFPNRVNLRAALQKTILDQVRGQHGRLVLAAQLPEATAFPESVVAGQPLPLAKPKGKESKAVVALAMELIQRAVVSDNSGAQEEAA